MVGHQFICTDDLDGINRTGCHVVHNHDVCGNDLVDLFQGEKVKLANGSVVQAKF